MANKKQIVAIISAVLFLVASATPSLAGAARARFLYKLSSFEGPIPYSWVRLSLDNDKNEIYVITGAEITIFNGTGMEIFSFAPDRSLGIIYDLAVIRNGNMVVLSEKGITLCNLRGEPISTIKLKNLPRKFSEFSPNRISSLKEKLYLADLPGKKVVVANENGVFEDGYDIGSLLNLEEKPGDEKEIVGFSIDNNGNILFTIPVLFKAYKLTPNRKVFAFGEKGSSPGKFNVVNGITADDKGNYLIADTLRGVVMAFDKEFHFLTEFGFRGYGPGNLIVPKNLAVNTEGKVFVSQGGRRGINVYKVTFN